MENLFEKIDRLNLGKTSIGNVIDEVDQLRARNAELEKYNKRWHEIADGFLGKKLDTHLGDKICIIGWKRDELITRNAELEAEVARLRKALERIADWPSGAQSDIAKAALEASDG